MTGKICLNKNYEINRFHVFKSQNHVFKSQNHVFKSQNHVFKSQKHRYFCGYEYLSKIFQIILPGLRRQAAASVIERWYFIPAQQGPSDFGNVPTNRNCPTIQGCHIFENEIQKIATNYTKFLYQKNM